MRERETRGRDSTFDRGVNGSAFAGEPSPDRQARLSSHKCVALGL